MTAEEFGEWKVWFVREQQSPQAVLWRHAQLLASTMNGPVTRASQAMYTATELMPADPWAPPPPPPPPMTNAAILAQVAILNARFGKP